MSSHGPTLQWLCPLSSWVGLRRPQLMALWLSMGSCKVHAVKLEHTVLCSLVWGGTIIRRHKIKRWTGPWP
jgi:hypothetical protein